MRRAKPMDKESQWGKIALLKEVCNGPHSHLCIVSEGHSSANSTNLTQKMELYQIGHSTAFSITGMNQDECSYVAVTLSKYFR